MQLRMESEENPHLRSSAAGVFFFPTGSLNLPIVDRLQVEWEEFFPM